MSCHHSWPIHEASGDRWAGALSPSAPSMHSPHSFLFPTFGLEKENVDSAEQDAWRREDQWARWPLLHTPPFISFPNWGAELGTSTGNGDSIWPTTWGAGRLWAFPDWKPRKLYGICVSAVNWCHVLLMAHTPHKKVGDSILCQLKPLNRRNWMVLTNPFNNHELLC